MTKEFISVAGALILWTGIVARATSSAWLSDHLASRDRESQGEGDRED